MTKGYILVAGTLIAGVTAISATLMKVIAQGDRPGTSQTDRRSKDVANFALLSAILYALSAVLVAVLMRYTHKDAPTVFFAIPAILLAFVVACCNQVYAFRWRAFMNGRGRRITLVNVGLVALPFLVIVGLFLYDSHARYWR